MIKQSFVVVFSKMGKNERIIAQDLSELKHALLTDDYAKLTELCDVLTRDMKKYSVKDDLKSRLEPVSEYSTVNSTNQNAVNEKVKILDELITVLISTR